MIMQFLSKLVYFIMATTKKFGIDESHGIAHSFNTLHNACDIYQNEKLRNAEMIPHEKVIYVAAAIHDMCDKKYMNEEHGIREIDKLLKTDMSTSDIHAVHDIIGKMSYSKVKKTGFPNMGKYQMAYNVVREADLLAAYDFDRAMIYHMYKNNAMTNNSHMVEEAYKDSFELFLHRMFRHEQDGMLTFEYSRRKADVLKYNSLRQMKQWKKIIRTLK